MTKILYLNKHHDRWPFERKTPGASGFDLHVAFSAEQRDILPGQFWKIPTGIHLGLPLGIEGQIRSRSGLACFGVVAIHGTIDADYTGEIFVNLRNFGPQAFTIRPGDRIAQLVFAPVFLPDLVPDHPIMLLVCSPWGPVTLERVEREDQLPQTARGASGFGSTGV